MGPVPIFDRMSQSIESKRAFSKRRTLLTKSLRAFSERNIVRRQLATAMEGPDEDSGSEASSPAKSSAPTTAAAADVDGPADRPTRREEAPVPILDEQTGADGLDNEAGAFSEKELMEAEFILDGLASDDGLLDDGAGPFSEREPMEAEVVLRHFVTFGAMLVLEVLGGVGAVWGFSQVLALRRPATEWFWRPVALSFGALFFGRWIKGIYDYFDEEDLGFFGDGALNDDEGGYGSSMTHQWNESSGFSDVDPEMLDHEDACKSSKMNKTIGSNKTTETENEESSLIGSQVTFGDIVERPRTSKFIDWGHDPSEKPNELYRIFGAKLVLEVFGGAGAIWGFSDILTLRNVATDWWWRPVTLAFALVFLVRWILQIRDYLAEDRTAEIDPRARLYQIFSAKLVLEVFGGAGAVWGFSEALALRDNANAWFWRPAALIFGVIFSVRWGMQIREYSAEENIEIQEEEAALVQEGDQTPLLHTNQGKMHLM